MSSKYPKPFLKWAGGKGALFPKIEKYLPSDYEKRRYVEPFVGGGAVFFRLRPKKAIINDSNPDLMNVYRVIRDNVEDLIKALKPKQKDVDSKEKYYEMRNKKPRTPVTKAMRIIYLNKTCFNGLYRVNSKGGFNVPFGDNKNPELFIEDNLKEVSNLLAGTRIEEGDYYNLLSLIKKNDFVYLDPPYDPLSETSSFTSYTKEGFGFDRQEQLVEFCKKLDKKGTKFLLNNSSTDKLKTLYKDAGFHIGTEDAPRVISSKGDKRIPVPELFVTNYPIDL